VCFATSPFAVFEAPALQALVVGIAVGAAVGKLVVRRRESWDGSELPAAAVRRVEAAWITLWVAVALVVQGLTELL